MASALLRSWLKPAGVPGGETPYKGNSVSATAGMTQSPSFNDFSLHVAQDVEHDLAEHAAYRSGSRHQLFGSNGPDLSGRDSSRLSEPASRDAEVTGGLVAGAVHHLTPQKALSMPLSRLSLQSHVPLAPPVARSARRKEGKIDGLDYYEWNELIRSNSL